MPTIFRPAIAILIAACCCSGPAIAQDEAPVRPGERPPAREPQREQPEGEAAKNPEPTFVLIESGREPRQPLRYDLSEQSKQATTLVMTMSSSIEMEGMELPAQVMPPLEVRMNVDVTEKREGAFEVVSTVMEGSVREDEGNEMVAAMMGQMMSGLKGLKTTSRMDPRGVIRGVNVEIPDGAHPQVEQMAKGMEQTLTQIGVHFPDEPVGVGARWSVLVPSELRGVKMTQTIEYELVLLEGNTAELKMKLSQSADRQALRDPDMPPGMEMELISMKGNGTGTAKVDLRRAAALKTTLDTTTTVEMRTADGEEGQEMKQTMEIKVELESTDR
jgi:hypothetical protein